MWENMGETWEHSVKLSKSENYKYYIVSHIESLKKNLHS